jgi:protein-S-isoprenylcysteine O-methyltransferase Ste14
MTSTVKVRMLAAQVVGMYAIIGLVLFLPAGTIHWLAGWIYILLMLGFTVGISAWLLRFNPELLVERMTGIGRPDQKAWDKVLLALVGLGFFAWLALMAVDAVRFRWSRMPLALQGAGAGLLVASFYLFYLTFRENPYLSPAVRVQTDRGQTVVTTGPYRYVRHPMYAGFIPFAIGTACLLGSWYGLLGAGLLIGLVAWRAVHEEWVLREELPGYSAYLARVRYRLVPYLW